jgi:hypothetical protein
MQLGGLRHTFKLLSLFLSTLCSESVSDLHCYPKVTSFGSDPRMTRAKSGPEACALQNIFQTPGSLAKFLDPDTQYSFVEPTLRIFNSDI